MLCILYVGTASDSVFELSCFESGCFERDYLGNDYFESGYFESNYFGSDYFESNYLALLSYHAQVGKCLVYKSNRVAVCLEWIQPAADRQKEGFFDEITRMYLLCV